MTAVAAFAVSAAPWLLIPGFHKMERACFWYIGLFALGMWAAHENFSPRVPRTNRLRNFELAAAVVVAIAVSAIAVKQLADNAFPAVFSLADGCVGAVTALLLHRWSIVTTERQDSPLLRFLSSPWLVGFGVFSYSFYLIHSRILERLISGHGVSRSECRGKLRLVLRAGAGRCAGLFARLLPALRKTLHQTARIALPEAAYIPANHGRV